MNYCERKKSIMNLLIIVPAYNESGNIKKTINNIKENGNYDYLIVDDCSNDNTYEICVNNDYNVIHLPVNYGLTSAVQIGFKYALKHGYDAALQFDGDGQHDAKYIKSMLTALEENDIVIGSRFVEKKKEFTSRMIGSRLLSFLIKITTGKKVHDPTSGMRMFRKEVFEQFAHEINYPPEPDTLVYMIRKNKRIKEVQVEMSDREYGESYLNLIRSVTYMLEMIVSIFFIQLFRKR